ncbi:MAG: FAD-dependent oxidoreductase [Deltaproteobacteria bacterium]|nr:FAD-dependent oxidoreductase [Deltaproteobacteria bacterium]
MIRIIDKESICDFKSMHPSMSLRDAVCEAERCLLCEDAPCSKGCPAGTDPGKFIRQIKFKNIKGAARTIRNNNILGSTCAHICPTDKLCEMNCSAMKLEAPINISALQKFAIEYGRQNNLEKLESSSGSGKKVAVIGAGPAGLSTAYELAKKGHSIEIFEKEKMAGGVPAWNIPEFRLPADEIAQDIGKLRDLGVIIHTNQHINTLEEVDKLKSEFDALVVATGLNKAFGLNVFQDAENVTDYMTWLKKIKFSNSEMKTSVANKRIAVVGGGSVAVDCCVSAKALGAAKVYMISLEEGDDLPADKEEIRLAQRMNVIFKSSSMIKSIDMKDGKVSLLRGMEIAWKEPENFNPSNATEVEGTDFSIPVDYVVQAIGTKPDYYNLFSELKLGPKSCFVAEGDEKMWASSGCTFAVGDVVNGGATVVRAVGEGKKLAEHIDKFLARGEI